VKDTFGKRFLLFCFGRGLLLCTPSVVFYSHNSTLKSISGFSRLIICGRVFLRQKETREWIQVTSLQPSWLDTMHSPLRRCSVNE
jgi:hypothetical protein